VCAEVGFSKIHIFPFSPRRGTPAAEMPGQVPPQVKAARGRHLAELEQRLRQRYVAGLVGRELDVLVEGEVLVEGAAEQLRPQPGRSSDPTGPLDGSGNVARSGHLAGTSCRYAPVALAADRAKVGQLVRVSATAVHGDHLLGSVAV
jgi:threonylcarbamoyladenosine tRNA methylthiotransferase MtaB